MPRCHQASDLLSRAIRRWAATRRSCCICSAHSGCSRRAPATASPPNASSKSRVCAERTACAASTWCSARCCSPSPLRISSPHSRAPRRSRARLCASASPPATCSTLACAAAGCTFAFTGTSTTWTWTSGLRTRPRPHHRFPNDSSDCPHSVRVLLFYSRTSTARGGLTLRLS